MRMATTFRPPLPTVFAVALIGFHPAVPSYRGDPLYSVLSAVYRVLPSFFFSTQLIFHGATHFAVALIGFTELYRVLFEIHSTWHRNGSFVLRFTEFYLVFCFQISFRLFH